MAGGGPFWRRRLLPAFLVLLILNLAVAAIWTIPRTLRLRNVTARVAAARAEAERERQAVTALRDRAEAIDANTADLAAFYETLVGEEQVELLPTLEDIEAMARAPGLMPGSRSFRREEVLDAGVERVAVTLPLEGSYEQLVGFLGEVERSSRFLTVDRISMRGDEDSGGALQVEMSAFMRLPEGAAVKRRRGSGR
jgi:Tfp pilus assembly protein PilO